MRRSEQSRSCLIKCLRTKDSPAGWKRTLAISDWVMQLFHKITGARSLLSDGVCEKQFVTKRTTHPHAKPKSIDFLPWTAGSSPSTMTIVPEHPVPCRLHFKGVLNRFNHLVLAMIRAEPAGMDGRVELMSHCLAINGKHFYGHAASKPAIALGILVFLLSSAVRAENGFVRVNQLGYELGAESRAYLMANGSESGSTFEVRNSGGKTVCTKPIGSPLGQWGKFTVYSLDFRVDLAGTYTIEVDGPFPAVSPSFRMDTAEHLYSQGIANALNFYQNERDGDNFIETPLRTAPSHLNDHHGIVYGSPQFDANDLIIGDLTRTGAVLDVSGGWWDAGDYLKFVQTHSYVIALMLIGIRDFPKQMGSSAGRSNFINEAEFGLRWLEKMWDDDSRTLYYQVGIGTDFENDPNLLSDHDLWRLPQADDTIGGTDPTLFSSCVTAPYS